MSDSSRFSGLDKLIKLPDEEAEPITESKVADFLRSIVGSTTFRKECTAINHDDDSVWLTDWVHYAGAPNGCWVLWYRCHLCGEYKNVVTCGPIFALLQRMPIP